jgi:RNA polymerase sigma-70 factor (ECF subfamily)
MASLAVEAKAARMKERPGISEQGGAGIDAELESVYRRHVALVYTLCLRLLATVQAAEEATVQVFALLSRELSSWWDEARILARLRQLAIDEALSRLPTREPAKATDTAFATAPSRGGVSGSGSSDAARPPLDQPTLDALVARLPDQLRVAFVLRDREGLSDGTIASHLRVEEAEVRRLVGRARFELRRLWTSNLLIVALTYVLLALCCPRFACFAQSQTQAQVVYSRAAEVTRIDGDVRLKRHGEAETTALLSGARLAPDDLILTGAGGRAELSMGPDSYLQIGHDSHVRVYEVTASTIHFDVERGEVFVIVRSLPREISLIVDTPPAPLTIAKRGRYLVQVAADGATEVAVEKGELSFTDSGNKTVRIRSHRRAHLSSKPKGA